MEFVISQQLNDYLLEAPRNDSVMYLISIITGVNFVKPISILPKDDADVIAICELYEASSQVRTKFKRIKSLSKEWSLFHDNFDYFLENYLEMINEMDPDDDHLIPSLSRQNIHFRIKMLYSNHIESNTAV